MCLEGHRRSFYPISFARQIHCVEVRSTCNRDCFGQRPRSVLRLILSLSSFVNTSFIRNWIQRLLSSNPGANRLRNREPTAPRPSTSKA